MKINAILIKIVLGVIRLALIICLLAGWISAAAVYSILCTTCNQLIGDHVNIRIAYLVFTLVGFVIAIVLFAMNFFERLNTLIYLKIANIAIDFIWMISLFILSIFCAIMETRYGPSTPFNVFNQGAFGAASVFGFFATFLYLIDALFLILTIILSNRVKKKYAPNGNFSIKNEQLVPQKKISSMPTPISMSMPTICQQETCHKFYSVDSYINANEANDMSIYYV